MSGFSLHLAEIAPAIGAQLVGADAQITGVSTDSRAVAPGGTGHGEAKSGAVQALLAEARNVPRAQTENQVRFIENSYTGAVATRQLSNAQQAIG